MAVNRYTIDGYGQLEINNCAFRRDGRIEAQCALDDTDFASFALLIVPSGRLLRLTILLSTFMMREPLA